MWKCKRSSVFTLACVLLARSLLLPAEPVSASWSIDSTENNPICTASGCQGCPQIISDGAGGAIITWQDNRNGASDIYAQRLDTSGNAMWTTDGVAVCTAIDHQSVPQIASDGSGGAIITWYDSRDGAPDIYAQRLDTSGNALWEADGVSVCTAYHYQTLPQIASDGSGGAIIAWLDYRNGTPDIYAQRLDTSGNAMWTTDGVAVCTATGDQTCVELVSDGSGGAIITWRDERSSNCDIYAQRVDASGNVQWTSDGIAVSTAADNQFYQKIVFDSSGGAIITWWDMRSGNSDIYAQRVDASGNTLWADNGTAIDPNISGSVPELVSDDAGGVIITSQGPGNKTDIYAQRVVIS